MAAILAAWSVLFVSCSSSDNVKIELLPVKTTKDGKWSMMNKDGELVYDSEFKNRPTVAVEGVFAVEGDNGITLYSTAQKTPTELPGCTELKSAGYMSDGLIPVTKKDSRITVINKKGKTEFELRACLKTNVNEK